MPNRTHNEDSFEKMLEQGVSDPKSKPSSQPPLQQMQNLPKSQGKNSAGIKELTSLGDPDAWVKDVYGVKDNGGKDSQSNNTSGVDELKSLGDPDAWLRDLYGVPQLGSEAAKKTAMEREQKKSKDNHTPLDMSKLRSKHDKTITPEQQKFFKKYNQEYEQFLAEKKRKVENEKKKAEEEERKKKEEADKRKKEEENQAGAGQGKQKQKLGQPRRKATTELHPETKMGGAK